MITRVGRLLTSLAERSAARRYARDLGPRLQRDYGSGQYYTAPQIIAAARKARLPQGHIAIGFAAFMPPEAFANLSPEGDYQALRNLYSRFVRAGGGYPAGPPGMTAYGWGADLSVSDPTHPG